MTPMNAYRNLSARIEGRFFRYIDKKHASSNTHELKQNRLYIFPTKRGWVFFLLNFTLWLLGTNYQNNLILGLTFLLAGIFVVAILHTYANLSGLNVVSTGCGTAHVGASLGFKIKLTRRARLSENLSLRFQHSDEVVTNVSVGVTESTLVEIPVATEKRGWMKPGRLLLESEYPIGLLRCWTWLNIDTQGLVFPEPLAVKEPQSIALDEDGTDEHPIKGGEDYTGLNPYNPGDAIKHIAWKVFARGRGLYTKEFSQNVSKEIWLDYSSIDGSGVENKLSGLCYWALEYEKADENYGLRLPGISIPPGKGDSHKYQVLRALACFDQK